MSDEFDDFGRGPNDDLVQPAGFRCPECNVPLRLKDQSQIGREIDCPDCRAPLLIVADAGEVRAQRAMGARGLQLPKRSSSKTTLRAIWLTTLCLGGVVVWLATRPDPASVTATKKPKEPVAAESEPTETTTAADSIPAPPSAEAVVNTVEAPVLPAPAADPPPLPVPIVDNKPIQPDLARDPPAVDVAAQLALRISEYSQKKPVQVRLLLRQVAELSAVPVDLSAVEVEPWKVKLDQSITVDLKQTTVADVMKEVLRQAGLAWRVQQDAIAIVPP